MSDLLIRISEHLPPDLLLEMLTTYRPPKADCRALGHRLVCQEAVQHPGKRNARATAIKQKWGGLHRRRYSPDDPKYPLFLAKKCLGKTLEIRQLNTILQKEWGAIAKQSRDSGIVEVHAISLKETGIMANIREIIISVDYGKEIEFRERTRPEESEPREYVVSKLALQYISMAIDETPGTSLVERCKLVYSMIWGKNPNMRNMSRARILAHLAYLDIKDRPNWAQVFNLLEDSDFMIRLLIGTGIRDASRNATK